MIQYFEIPSIDATIRKSMLDGIVQRLLLESGVKDSEIVYDDEELGTRRQPGTQAGDSSRLTFGQGERVFIEFSETPDEMERIARGVGLDRQLPFFSHPKHNIHLAPILRKYDVEITITNNSASKDQLQKWCNRLNGLIDMGRYSLMTESEFYYLVPTEALALIRDCYTVLNTRVQDYPNLNTFLKEGFHNHVTIVSSVTGTGKRIAVRHAPTRVEVVYDVSGPEQIKKELGYEAKLTARFTYDRPVEVKAFHPLILNQTAINEKWRPTVQIPYLSNELDVDKSTIQAGLDDVANYYDNAIALPWLITGDDSLRKQALPDSVNHTIIVGSDVMFEQDNMEKPDVLSIDNLPFTFHPAIREYIRDCHDLDPYGNNCVFLMQFFKNKMYLGKKAGTWDNEGYWVYDGNIDVRANYFFVIVFINNWLLLDIEQQKMLRKHPEALKLIYEWWNKTKVLDIPTNRPLDWATMEEVVESMTRRTVYKNQGVGNMITVMNSTIITFPPKGENHADS